MRLDIGVTTTSLAKGYIMKEWNWELPGDLIITVVLIAGTILQRLCIVKFMPKLKSRLC